MIYQYIKEIIEKESRLILPELGAFLTKEVDNKKVIFFNDVLKYNDGTLTNYMAEKENISVEESQIKITEYLRLITNTIIEKGEFEIQNLGILYKDEKGYINLKETESNTTSENEELYEIEENIEITNIETPTNEINKEEIDLSKDNEIFDIIDEPKLEQNIENTIIPEIPHVPNDTVIENKDIEEEEVKIEDSKLIEFNSSPENTIVDESDVLSIENEESLKEELSESVQSSKKKSSKGLIITLIIVIPIALLIGAGFIFKDKVMSFYNDFTGGKKVKTELVDNKKKSKISDKKAISNATKIDSSKSVISNNVDSSLLSNTISEVKKEEKTENKAVTKTQPTVSSNMNLKYHCIAASFNSMSEAEKYSNNLKNSGYPNSKVLDSGNGKYRVSFDSFATREEANSNLQKITSTGAQSWILTQ